MHAKGALPEDVLQAEPPEIVSGADRVGQGEEGVLVEVPVVQNDSLADPQFARTLLLDHRTVDASDYRRRDVRLFVEVEEPGGVRNWGDLRARSGARAP